MRKLVFGEMRPWTPRETPIPMDERPVYFNVGAYERQSGGEVITAEDAAQLEADGYTVVWPTDAPARGT